MGQRIGRKLRQYVELMGGIFVMDSIPHETKYFVCESSLSLKYQVAAQRSLVIVYPTWILDSFKVFKMLPTDKYAVPPLKGCSVAVIGLCKQSSDAVKQIVESMGGSYVKYSDSPTHVIASQGLPDVIQTEAHNTRM